MTARSSSPMTVFHRLTLIGLLAVSAASAQNFRIAISQGGNTSLIQSGSQLIFNTPINSITSASVTATYLGTGQIVIENQPVLLGSTAFTAGLQATLPLTLTQGRSVTFELRFRPTGAAAANAQFSLGYTEIAASTGGSGTPATTQGAITLSLQGTAPSYSLSYILQADQNVVPLPPNGTLDFGPSLSSAVAQAAFNVSNIGSGTGAVTGISISGPAFRLSRLPLFPSPVVSAQVLQVLVLYTPTTGQVDEGQITVSFDSSPPVTINVRGNGIAPQFTYEVLRDGTSTPVPAGGSIELPSVAVGQSSTAIIQVTNSGEAPGTLVSLLAAGSGFSISTGPVLPVVLAPKASTTFVVTFAPARTGTVNGNLIVNSDRFVLTGTGLGSQLTYSYAVGDTIITLDGANNLVVFSPVQVTSSASIVVTVKNTGTLAAPISNIGPGQTDGIFTLSGLPTLPLSLAPGAEFPITVKFSPNTVGFTTGQLRIDGTALNLIGSGTTPPPLPAFTFSGPSGNTAPGPYTATLTLAAPYPVAISGTLTMAVSSSLPSDPAAQFLTGGQTVRFVIPANSTVANFASQGSQISFQTGTVASTITLTPSFATTAGGVDLTPASPNTLRLTIPAARPTLLAVQVSGQTASSLTVNVTGFTTSRSLTSMVVEFTPAPGVQMSTTRFTIDLQQLSNLWFRSTASQAFGGQFTVAIPFSFQGIAAGAQSIASTISSVSVKVSNESGESNSLQAGTI